MSEPTLTPPSATAGLVLEPPKAVAAVAPAKAGGMVPIDTAASHATMTVLLVVFCALR